MERDFATVRTGRASTSLVERIPVEYYGTLDAAQPAGQHQRPRVAPGRHPAVGPGRPGRHREGHPEERHRPDAQRRRHGRPAQHPAAHRGATTRPGQGRPQAHGRGHRSRSATIAATAPDELRKRGEGRRPRRRRGAPRARARREGDPPLDRRGRPASARPRSRRSWRSDDLDRHGRTAPGDGTPPVDDAGATACRATSPSSWTATGAGRASGACPRRRAMPRASRPSGPSWSAPQQRGVEVLSIYAFSRENWAARQRRGARPSSRLLDAAIRDETPRPRAAGRARSGCWAALDELRDADPRVHRGGPRGAPRRDRA